MYCHRCGKGEQTPDSYCRNCGEYLADISSRAHLISRFLGINTPEQQIKFNLTIDLITAIISFLLVAFLMGYFEGRQAATGETAPAIIYLVYGFLGLVAAWQFLSFLVGLRFKRKLSTQRLVEGQQNTSLASASAGSLPEANAENVVAASITENTTRHLDKVTR